MRKFVLLAALVMVMSVTGAANAAKEHFAHWGCNETVTWKTNGSKKLVKRQARLINKTVDSFTLVKHKGRGKPDINIKFVTPAKIVRSAGDNDVLGIAYYGLIDQPFARSKVLAGKKGERFKDSDVLKMRGGPKGNPKVKLKRLP